MDLHGGSDGKESTCTGGDLGSIPGLGRSPGEGKGYPFQYFLPGEFHGQKSMVGYSPRGCKESGTTYQLTLSLPKQVQKVKGRGNRLHRFMWGVGHTSREGSN